MHGLLNFARLIDRILAFFSGIGGWLGATLVLVVCYDVITRYFGVPKPAGINSTMIQEAQYWLHSGLIVFCIGYAYVRGAHVRIDLIRENLSDRRKYWIEAIGLCLALIPYTLIGIMMAYPYVRQSFLSGEISKSQTGLSNLWILKAGMVIMFILLLLAGISQLIKAIAGIRGQLPDETRDDMFGGAH